MNETLPSESFRVEAPPHPADLQALRDNLAAFNVNQAAFDHGQQMAIFHRDETGQIIAGIYGWLWGQCLEIVLLWTDEPLRGQGLGSRLLAQLEATGQQHGARLAMLEIFSFQAPAFYQKRGYETFGVIEGYGDGHAKHFMHKQLS
ncbi:MAG: GNAT family N-acetyltransferase [Chloroflexota bacterium]|jgi:GNAT superfamily N-acetyltransferase